jgi:hypothetical protein
MSQQAQMTLVKPIAGMLGLALLLVTGPRTGQLQLDRNVIVIYLLTGGAESGA